MYDLVLGTKHSINQAEAKDLCYEYRVVKREISSNINGKSYNGS